MTITLLGGIETIHYVLCESLGTMIKSCSDGLIVVKSRKIPCVTMNQLELINPRKYFFLYFAKSTVNNANTHFRSHKNTQRSNNVNISIFHQKFYSVRRTSTGTKIQISLSRYFILHRRNRTSIEYI